MPLCAYAVMNRLTGEQIDLVTTRARALGDATRVRILLALGRGEKAVGQIADLTRTRQSTVSKHLQVLFHAGLVQRRRSAATVYYWLGSPHLLDWLRDLGAPRPKQLPRFTSVLVRKANPAGRRARPAT
jgi:DNA-binding transcriptional ArsR family regulator